MPGSHATRALLTPNVCAISSIIGLAITSPVPIKNMASDSGTTGFCPDPASSSAESPAASDGREGRVVTEGPRRAASTIQSRRVKASMPAPDGERSGSRA
jgi:hypothetical protein